MSVFSLDKLWAYAYNVNKERHYAKTEVLPTDRRTA